MGEFSDEFVDQVFQKFPADAKYLMSADLLNAGLHIQSFGYS